MHFVSQFATGVSAVFQSFGRVGAKVYAVIFALCLLLFIGGVVLGTSLFSVVSDWVSGYILASFSLPDAVSGILPSAASWLGGALVFVVCFLLVGYIGGSVILLVLSPVLSHVADKAWALAGHKIPNDSFAGVLRSVFRGIVVALRCLCLQVLCLVLVLILSFVPVVNIATPILSLLVSAFFYGQAMVDYAVERAEQEGAFKSGKGGAFPFYNIGLTVGIGILYALVMLIPFVGSYLALYIAPASVCAGGSVVGKAAAAKE